MNNKALRRLW